MDKIGKTPATVIIYNKRFKHLVEFGTYTYIHQYNLTILQLISEIVCDILMKLCRFNIK